MRGAAQHRSRPPQQPRLKETDTATGSPSAAPPRTPTGLPTEARKRPKELEHPTIIRIDPEEYRFRWWGREAS